MPSFMGGRHLNIGVAEAQRQALARGRRAGVVRSRCCAVTDERGCPAVRRAAGRVRGDDAGARTGGGPERAVGGVPSSRVTVVRAGGRLLPVIPIAVTAFIYFPITRNYFFGDDFVCLARIINDGFLRFALRPSGGHNLFARNAVFYASY